MAETIRDRLYARRHAWEKEEQRTELRVDLIIRMLRGAQLSRDEMLKLVTWLIGQATK